MEYLILSVLGISIPILYQLVNKKLEKMLSSHKKLAVLFLVSQDKIKIIYEEMEASIKGKVLDVAELKELLIKRSKELGIEALQEYADEIIPLLIKVVK